MTRLALRKKGNKKNDVVRFRNEIDNLFNSCFEDWDWPELRQDYWPAIDVDENENEIVINAEVPGCKADDIDISVNGNILTISGEKKQEQEQKEKNSYYVERSYGSFRRDISLPTEIEPDKIDAGCKDGVLTVKLPKNESSKAVKIKVKGQ